jgi:hypothetical protein
MPLTIDAHPRQVEYAELSLRVETETYDGAAQRWIYARNPSLLLALEIRLEEISGEDGAPAPDLYLSLPADLPASLRGVLLDESNCSAEAWIGAVRGAPGGGQAAVLQDNRLEILSPLQPGKVSLRWSACDEGGKDLLFEGEAEFTGISFKVKRVTDVEMFLRKVWPALQLQSLELVSETEVDYGEDSDEDRRHWMELHYDFKP